ncbi:Bug family tripartite tricarboxylate transporter substrate binding protein [Methylobacterium aquaticum]|uniref:Bug family tripartite tricarboxylate transporter substrate binding protein n=1 Tax=Methylobacterium aquaticum TaxID=270351 RepID=UPI001FEF01FA|nr:tripartite tricarboxylate transporter substrate-binding protein [Methylobacterium aquaticum]
MFRRIAAAAAMLAASCGLAAASWKPAKTVEFVAVSGPGGGTDQFARTVQSIIAKHRLMEVSTVVVTKGGGSGAEGLVYGGTSAGDPHKLVFATNNAWLLPLVAKLAFKPSDLTPVAALAVDEFLIWVHAGSPHRSIAEFVAAARSAPFAVKFAGSQAKDTDQILVKQIEAAAGAQVTYLPFKGGGEAGIQLAGGHVDANVNNPNENIGHWKGGLVRPLCVFSPTRLTDSAKVTGTAGWADIPTCREAGLTIDQYQMPRTVFLPGKVPSEAVAYYADVLRRVHETPEWRDYIQRTVQTSRFLAGAEFAAFIRADEQRGRDTITRAGWLVQ